MSAARTMRNLSLTAAGLVLALAFTASAVPLQSSAATPRLNRSGRPASRRDPPRLAGLSRGRQGGQGAGRRRGEPDRRQGRLDPRREGGRFCGELDRLGQLAPKKGTPEALEGDPRLAVAAVAAVKQWRYQPFQVNGKPVDVRMTVTINFKL